MGFCIRFRRPGSFGSTFRRMLKIQWSWAVQSSTARGSQFTSLRRSWRRNLPEQPETTHLYLHSSRQAWSSLCWLLLQELFTGVRAIMVRPSSCSSQLGHNAWEFDLYICFRWNVFLVGQEWPSQLRHGWEHFPVDPLCKKWVCFFWNCLSMKKICAWFIPF